MGSVEFLLLWYEKQNAGTMKEGTVPVPPYRPCAERWWRCTCSGVIASEEPQRRGWNPLERSDCNWTFLQNLKMQSLFHPVWMSPKGNHVCFHGLGAKRINSCLFLEYLKKGIPARVLRASKETWHWLTPQFLSKSSRNRSCEFSPYFSFWTIPNGSFEIKRTSDHPDFIEP